MSVMDQTPKATAVDTDDRARQTVEALQEATAEATTEAPEAPQKSANVLDLREETSTPEVVGSLDEATPEARQEAVEAASPPTLEESKGDRLQTLRQQIAEAPGDKQAAAVAQAEYQEGRKEDLLAARQETPTGGSLLDRVKHLFKR